MTLPTPSTFHQPSALWVLTVLTCTSFSSPSSSLYVSPDHLSWVPAEGLPGPFLPSPYQPPWRFLHTLILIMFTMAESSLMPPLVWQSFLNELQVCQDESHFGLQTASPVTLTYVSEYGHLSACALM